VEKWFFFCRQKGLFFVHHFVSPTIKQF